MLASSFTNVTSSTEKRIPVPRSKGACHRRIPSSSVPTIFDCLQEGHPPLIAREVSMERTRAPIPLILPARKCPPTMHGNFSISKKKTPVFQRNGDIPWPMFHGAPRRELESDSHGSSLAINFMAQLKPSKTVVPPLIQNDAEYLLENLPTSTERTRQAAETVNNRSLSSSLKERILTPERIFPCFSKGG